MDVVTADYADVERAAYRDEVFLRPDGINSDPEADREPHHPLTRQRPTP